MVEALSAVALLLMAPVCIAAGMRIFHDFTR